MDYIGILWKINLKKHPNCIIGSKKLVFMLLLFFRAFFFLQIAEVFGLRNKLQTDLLQTRRGSPIKNRPSTD